jgi:diguanylate cyclase (GGDEF)-like protein
VRRFTLPRLGLLGKFAVLSFLPVLVLGVALGTYLEGRIHERAVTKSQRAAQLIAQLGIQPQLTAIDLERGLSPAQLIEIDRSLAGGLADSDIEGVKIWNRAGTIVYADDRSVIGRSFERTDELEGALGGRVVSEVSDGGEDAEDADHAGRGDVLEVYVPLRFPGSVEPLGAFEIYLSYAPIAAEIAAETRTVNLILLAGLGLLYASIFKIVQGASRKLRRQAELNEHQALHDPLTSLPNRSLFRDRIEHAIATAHRDGGSVGVLIMDVDRFKEVNDTLGHHSGDELLVELGMRLRGALREVDTVARLGGDEFGIVLPGAGSPVHVAEVAERIREALREPFVMQGLPLAVEVSVGGALVPLHAPDADTAIQRADVAMYLAKTANTDFELYDAKHDEYDPARLGLIGELRRAIEQDEIVLYFQPKAELRTGAVRGAEALVRWRHPERGLLGPDEFIPLAQHTGLIRPLTLHVVDGALRQCHLWRREGFELHVAVNLAMRNLLDLSFPDDVAHILRKWNVEPGLLELEITESTIMGDPFRARQVLERLNEMGVRLSIDDFGTGYSSLGYLKRLPVTEIKIDKSFVMNMTEDENDAVIVRSTIDLGRNLGLEVVAEGVESAEIWRDLERWGCDVAQGYYLSRPVPAEDLTAWLRRTGGSLGPAEDATADVWAR